MKKAFEELTEESIIQLHEKVTGMKHWRELEIRYMMFEELLRSRERKGKAEGKARRYYRITGRLGNGSAGIERNHNAGTGSGNFEALAEISGFCIFCRRHSTKDGSTVIIQRHL